MKINIRPARESDLPALALLWEQVDGLHARIRSDYFRASPERSLSGRNLKEALGSPHQTLLVAEQKGDVVGVVEVKIYDTPDHPLMMPRRRARVEELVVDLHHRRCGIGRALMEEAVCWARRQSASHVVLTVWSGNDEAEAFYKRLGYHPVCQVLGLEF